ncbi:TlpA disulfide reductase family protein [Porphyromonas sp.]|uniref:TlpA disulfide reductase family protein n=1 Tax=Porphyromonas sp. TaxID=1924944 RepID=UPI0026DD0DD3|nr:TlpA disulfide reductase family protein [Porphyromonas sp.]MDO4770641.1 TlpA disulfide reductase family protein [Porphyromonas sp.]
MKKRNNLKNYFKKSKTLLLLSGSIFALYGCMNSPVSVLRGDGIPAEYEGKHMFIENSMTGTVDSLKVESGTFSYTLPVDTTILYRVDIEGNEAGNVFFIAEEGEHRLQPKHEAIGFHIEGGRLNNELRAMISKVSEMNNEQAQGVMANFRNSKLSNEEKAYANHLQAIQYREMATNLYSDYLSRHSDNAIGMLAFSRLEYKDDDEFIKAYEAQSEVVKQGFAQRMRYEKIFNNRKTQEGMPYSDFEINMVDGKTIKFSDFMEEGKYLLVDFWASWCVPCRKIMPYVKDMINRFPSDSLTMVSIGSFDKPEPYTKAAKEEDIPWRDVLDVNSNGARVYGVTSIPHFILISPQGEIVKRASNVLHVEAVLEERLLNK